MATSMLLLLCPPALLTETQQPSRLSTKIVHLQCATHCICTAVQARSDQARNKVADMEDKVSVHTARLVACQEELLGLQDQVKAAQQAADLVLTYTGSAHVLPLSALTVTAFVWFVPVVAESLLRVSFVKARAWLSVDSCGSTIDSGLQGSYDASVHAAEVQVLTSKC